MDFLVSWWRQQNHSEVPPHDGRRLGSWALLLPLDTRYRWMFLFFGSHDMSANVGKNYGKLLKSSDRRTTLFWSLLSFFSGEVWNDDEETIWAISISYNSPNISKLLQNSDWVPQNSSRKGCFNPRLNWGIQKANPARPVDQNDHPLHHSCYPLAKIT